jgi:hypothetical protein
MTVALAIVRHTKTEDLKSKISRTFFLFEYSVDIDGFLIDVPLFLSYRRFLPTLFSGKLLGVH